MPTETQNSNARNTESGGKWVRRIAPIVVLCGGLGVALFAGTRVPRTDAQPAAVETAAAQSAAVSEQAAAVKVVEKPATTEYQPIGYGGVMVRHIPAVPAKASGANSAQSARIKILPGGTRPAFGSGGGTYGQQPSTVNRTTLPGGAVRRLIPSSMQMAERARIVNGRLQQYHGRADQDAEPAGR